jgi:hypothetical protein
MELGTNVGAAEPDGAIDDGTEDGISDEGIMVGTDELKGCRDGMFVAKQSILTHWQLHTHCSERDFVGINVGVVEGIEEGLAVGLKVGIDEGRTDGIPVGVLDGFSEGISEGVSVGTSVGSRLGVLVGEAVGFSVGAMVGIPVGMSVGIEVGHDVGDSLGDEEGTTVGANVGDGVGMTVGTPVGIWVVGEKVGGGTLMLKFPPAGSCEGRSVMLRLEVVGKSVIETEGETVGVWEELALQPHSVETFNWGIERFGIMPEGMGGLDIFTGVIVGLLG